jgi:hypothetical protein
MTTSRLPLGVALLLSSLVSAAGAAELPKTITSAPCRVPPTIDGVIGADEWKGATAVKFDLKMIQFTPAGTTTWACELRVMNSANALYLALRVPDKTVNDTFSPPDMDFAVLAFCQGKEVAAGDDRKAHLKYHLGWTRDVFLERALAGKVAAGQLTPVKLERLMDRYAGKEWLPSRLKQLDSPEGERADVLRGLRTYVGAGAENAKTFARLYAKLPAAKQVLPAKVVKELSGAK